MTIHSPTTPIAFPGDCSRILLVPPDLRFEAAARLVTAGHRPDRTAATRFLEDTSRNRIPLNHFWAWVGADSGVEAAVLAIPSPGKTALMFASRPAGFGRATKISRTIDFACDALADEGIIIAQALLEARERAERKTYEQSGFAHLANLHYLQRSLDDRDESIRTTWPAGATVETYSSANHADFVSALEISYEGTMDCPALTGLRSPEDILTGHRATGEFDPRLWMLLRLNGRAIGVLLLNANAAQGTIELVYIGLAPEARRRGLARLLLHHGLRAVARRVEKSMTLAVDERNLPAVRLYQSEGLRRLLRRVAMFRALGSAFVTPAKA